MAIATSLRNVPAVKLLKVAHGRYLLGRKSLVGACKSNREKRPLRQGNISLMDKCLDAFE
jgi:hypothetical protein